MNSLFLKKLHGKMVQVITNNSMLTDHGPAPLVEAGFLVDCDDKFLYLGSQNPLEITKAIKIDHITLIDTDLPNLEEEKLLLGDFEGDDNEEMN